ncbi:DUF4169 family protein [uncultured Boseongicola sp.]|jgi:hypothetical protein|uniref:DUF4169 family protein n=1 Tax=uncultured Boseongicola sp. TaxID=1648499 RepID=UPI002628953C|nr:DUF4169 family protein [uncultured Boseongicola sp.]
MNTANLNRARKEKLKNARKADADGNAMKYGRSKADKLAEAKKAALAMKRHEANKKEP